MRDFRIACIAVALLPLISACGDDEPSGPATSFSANLTGDQEVPAVATDASGSATLDIIGDQINYTVNVSSLENPVVSHIHIEAVGENGPVRLNLCGTPDTTPCATGDGVLVAGTNGATVGDPAITFDQLVEAMRTGNAYVNVHTNDGVGQPNTGPGDMQSGEIRGQIVAD
jgi:CHRD domain